MHTFFLGKMTRFGVNYTSLDIVCPLINVLVEDDTLSL